MAIIDASLRGVKKCKLGKEKYSEVCDYLRSDEDFKAELMSTIIENMPEQKKGAKKDPNEPEGRPKRPKSAYFFFQDSKRDELKETYGLTGKKATMVMGQMWNGLRPNKEGEMPEDLLIEHGLEQISPSEKKKFEKKAEKAKAKYNEEKKAWEDKCEELGYKRPSDAALALLPENQKKRKSSSGKKKADPKPADYPKAVANTYLIFSKWYRKEHPGKYTGAEMSAIWKEFQTKKKNSAKVAEIKAEYEADKARFEKALKKWVKKNPDHPLSQPKSKGKKAKKDADEEESQEEDTSSKKSSTKKTKVSTTVKATRSASKGKKVVEEEEEQSEEEEDAEEEAKPVKSASKSSGKKGKKVVADEEDEKEAEEEEEDAEDDD